MSVEREPALASHPLLEMIQRSELLGALLALLDRLHLRRPEPIDTSIAWEDGEETSDRR